VSLNFSLSFKKNCEWVYALLIEDILFFKKFVNEFKNNLDKVEVDIIWTFKKSNKKILKCKT